MTRRGFSISIFLILAILFAVFVWPTRYRPINVVPSPDQSEVVEQRVDRLTGRIEQRIAGGKWIEYAPPPPDFDPKVDTSAGREVSRAQQAGNDIRKMNEVAKKATEH